MLCIASSVSSSNNQISVLKVTFFAGERQALCYVELQQSREGSASNI